MVAHHLIHQTPLVKNGLVVAKLKLHFCQHFDGVFEVMDTTEHETLMKNCGEESV